MNVGRTLILVGLVLVAAGLFLNLGGKLPFRLGKLPGDISWEGKNGWFYFPVVTCLLLSVIGSFVLWLIQRR